MYEQETNYSKTRSDFEGDRLVCRRFFDRIDVRRGLSFVFIVWSLVSASLVAQPDSGEADTAKLATNGSKVPVKKLGEGRYSLGDVEFDIQKKEIVIPAEVNMPKGLVEYVLVHDEGKVHESIFTTVASAKNVHVAMLLLGMKGKDGAVRGVPMEVILEWKGKDGSDKRSNLLELLELGSGDSRKSNEAKLPENTWRYCGDVVDRSGPVNLEYEGSLIALMKDPAALVNNVWIKQDPQNNSSGGQAADENQEGQPKPHMHGNQSAKKDLLPNKGTPVRIKLKLYEYPNKDTSSTSTAESIGKD
ncbi:hypothetical protein Rhal01_01356 [Rubritalea halochordaticola]|uniref:DUF4412 domain-containing protein n=1 Tax=Rubritalea halochordaticola TaxID=714537 RepID=A0ABP9UXJ7_9BACT